MVFNSVGYSKGKYKPGGSRKKVNFSRQSARKGLRSTKSKKKGGYKKGSKNDFSLNNIYNKLVDNQLSVYKFPFSTKTKYPKIPDLKVDNSIGLPFNYTKQVSLGATIRNVEIVLYPGMTDCLVVTGTDINGANPVELGNSHFIQHLLPRYKAETATATTLDYKDCGYSKYRYVSCGLRLGSDSGVFNNSGYWESIRIPIGKVTDKFRFVNNYTDALFNHVYPVVPLSNEEFISSPTYQSGSLKQLGNYEFRLKDNCNEHEFIEIPETIEFNNTLINGDGLEASNVDGYDGTVLFNHIADSQFDIIMVRLRFNQNTSFSFHTSANIELVPNSHGNFNHFSMPNVTNKSKLGKTRREVEKFQRLPGVYNGKYTKN